MFQLGLQPPGALYELSKTKCTLHCTATAVFGWVLFSWILEAYGLKRNAVRTCNAELTVITYIVFLHVKFYATFFRHPCLQSCCLETDRDVIIRAHIQHTQSQYSVSHLSVSADSYFHYSRLFRMLLFLFFVLIVPFIFLSPSTLIIIFVLEIYLTCMVYVCCL
jgi:hypothetical protein